MLWNPEKPCTRISGYGWCVAGVVGWPYEPPPLLAGGAVEGSDGCAGSSGGRVPVQPIAAIRPKNMTRFIMVRSSGPHMRAWTHRCQVTEFKVEFTHCVNYMSHRETADG